MADGIAHCAVGRDIRDAGASRIVEVLPAAIEGVETRYHFQLAGADCRPARRRARARTFLFVHGTGEASVEGKGFPIAGLAALCPAAASVRLRATSAPLEYLEIGIDLRDDEAVRLESLPPFFIPYAQCEPYAEAIKSPKTISRTIVPPHIVPRFCMGSVETAGPDAVGAHAHPMLEQLFFGLPGNQCVVTADESEVAFGEGMLLHIPLGSWHGVRVEAGKRLHYVWMDFFREERELAYIAAQHTPL
jgi:mannose-6-phosphate isomerase-like protein (cupin superfamily)